MPAAPQRSRLSAAVVSVVGRQHSLRRKIAVIAWTNEPLLKKRAIDHIFNILATLEMCVSPGRSGVV